MLARTPTTLVYLSAAELGITERERAGLIEVRDDLASGRVKHAPDARWHGDETYDPNASAFNMRSWASTADCGTAHCIGGFVEARGCLEEGIYSRSLCYLFYPGNCTSGADQAYNAIPAQAVRAIDHFLAGAGAECWPMALQDIPAA